MPAVAHRRVEAVVGHHRNRDAGHAEVLGGEGDHLVAVDHGAGPVHGEHAVAVAVEREAEVVAAGGQRRLQRVEVRRAAAGVDVATVRLGGDHVDMGAEAAEDLRPGLEGRAVRAVQQHAAAGQVEVGEALMQGAQVVLQRAVEPAHAPDPGGRPGRCQHRLDLQLDGVGELEAVAAEELDAVVLVRVVRRRQHDREVEPVALDQQRRSGRRAARRRAAPRRRQPRSRPPPRPRASRPTRACRG